MAQMVTIFQTFVLTTVVGSNCCCFMRYQPINQSIINQLTETRAGEGGLLYTQDNHTSVIGMRELAPKWKYLPYEFDVSPDCELVTESGNNLFVYPLQSNFCGRKYPFSICKSMQNEGYFVCVDAASFVSSDDLHLGCDSGFEPDFVPISFYKIFGYPTGLGCLLVKNSSAFVLDKSRSYFGGGTVQLAPPTGVVRKDRKEISERFEDGTINFYAIAQLKYCLEYFNGLQDSNTDISAYDLTKMIYLGLEKLKHHNGAKVAQIYCHDPIWSKTRQGTILAFNLKSDDGSHVGYSEVSKMAELYNIDLRTGCFCNLGACQFYLGLTDETLIQSYGAGKVCGDEMDLLDGRPLGCVRISLGRYSSMEDVQTFLGMVYDCFCIRPFIKWKQLFPAELCEKEDESKIIGDCIENRTEFGSEVEITDNSSVSSSVFRLLHIFIHPIKSCRGQIVDEWTVGETGLDYDRYWMIVNKDGLCMTQKRSSKLSQIHASVDLERCQLIICGESSTIRLDIDPDVASDNGSESVKVCMDRVSVSDCGESLSNWLESNINLFGARLVRQTTNSERLRTAQNAEKLSLVNEAPILLVNRRSISALHRVIKEINPSLTEIELLRRFRPNLVIDGPPPFEEETWKNITIGELQFEVIGKCHRCQMICIDQNTGLKNPHIMKCLRDITPEKQMTFGVYLVSSNKSYGNIRVGDKVGIQ